MNKKFKKIISHYKPYKKTLILDLILSTLSELIVVSVPIMCHYITDKAVYLEKYDAIRNVSYMAIIIIIMYIFFFMCKRYTGYKGKMFASKIEVDIENELFKHFQYQDFSFYDEQKVGKLMSYITTDAYNLNNIIKSIPESTLGALIRFIAVFSFLFFYNKVFGLILFGFFVLILVFMWIVLPKVQNANKLSREIFSNITSDLEENLSGMKTVKSFTNEQIEVTRFINNCKTYLKSKDRMYDINSIFYSGLLSFVFGIGPIITVAGAFFVINNVITIGDIIAFVLYIDVLKSPIWDIVNLNEFLREGLVGFNRIIDILDNKPQITDSSHAIKTDNVNGDIEFKDVFFKYDKTSKNIFEGLNLKINAGEYIALVGASGVGKSTFCNLIPRFYDVSKGEILIDGINVKDIKLSNLRQNIGFVHQDTFLFSGTIMENIRYGRPYATDEEVIESAKNAYAHDFIMNFPNGYNTQIGTRGLKLSGGQRQRLAIARVFLKNPSILIFDEATSSLDNESERYVQKSIEKLAIGRTTIVIAHRLSTIKNSNRVLVLANGKIVEKGIYEELIPDKVTIF